jgi:hypothetical protein
MMSSLVLRLLSSAFNPTREASVKRTRTRAISAIKKIMVEYGGLVTSTYPVTNQPINIPARMNIIWKLIGSLPIKLEKIATTSKMMKKTRSSTTKYHPLNFIILY